MATVLENGKVLVSEETAQALKVFGYNDKVENRYYTILLKDSAITVYNPDEYDGVIVNEYDAPELSDIIGWIEQKFNITFNVNKKFAENGAELYWWDVLDTETKQLIRDYSFVIADNEWDALSETLDLLCKEYVNNMRYSDNAAIYCPNKMDDIINKLKSIGYTEFIPQSQYDRGINEGETIYIDLHGCYMKTVNNVVTDIMYDEKDIDNFLNFAETLYQTRTYSEAK